MSSEELPCELLPSFQEGLLPRLSGSFPFQAAVTEPIWSEETFAELLGSGELQSSVTGAGGGWGWGALPRLM